MKLIGLKVVREMFSVSPRGEMTEETRQLLAAMDEVYFTPGSLIIKINEPADDGMYILLEGSAAVLDQGGQPISQQMGPGDIVGEMALIRDEPRGATIRAETAVICAHLSKSQFEEAARQNRRLYGNLLSMAYKKNTELVREQARLHSELEIATRIQDGLLRTDFADIESHLEIKIAALMKPAKEVGGDFYDIFRINGRKACVIVADVSGKGVPAAMFMAMALTHIRNYAKLDMPLTELAYRVNNQLCEDNPEEMFVTAFIGKLDMDTGILTYINAGHNLPFLAEDDNGFTRISSKVDRVFGMWENTIYRRQTLVFCRPWKLFLYTDGVTEAENRFGELFGDKRLGDSLNRYARNSEHGQLTGSLYRELVEYAGGAGQTDDITMLYISAGEDRREVGIFGSNSVDAARCDSFIGTKSPTKCDAQLSGSIFQTRPRMNAPAALKIQVPARMTYMEPVLEEVSRYLAAQECPDGVMTKLEIALEEIFTNVASYAYQKEDGQICLSCSVEQGTGFLNLEITDQGIPFNPLEKEAPDFETSFDTRPVGGLGIYMVKQFVDEAEYEYRDGCNILTVKKTLI